MSICFENFALSETSCKKLLQVVDRMLDEYLFKGDSLLELGWCSLHMLDKRIVRYPKGSKIEKTSIVEFYWFKNRVSDKQICDCMSCTFFKLDSKKRVVINLSIFHLVGFLRYFIYIGIINVTDSKGD